MRMLLLTLELSSRGRGAAGREGAHAVQSLLDGASQPRAGIAQKKPGRSGGIVDAREETSPAHADRFRGDRADRQSAKMRAAKSMVKTSRLRGPG